MNVLLTGAFGNVGRSALEELTRHGHRVRCFDLKTKANRRAARSFEGQIEVVWGDLREPSDVAAAVQGARCRGSSGFHHPEAVGHGS